MIPYNVKGSSIESKLAYVRETFGQPAEARLRSDIEGLEKNLLMGGWYPYELYDRLLRAIAANHFRGSLKRLEDVGEYSAQTALTTTYRPFAVAKDLSGLIRRLSSLHRMYYDRGAMRLADSDDERLTIVLSGAPTYSEADLHVAAGFYIGAARVVGKDAVSASITFNSDGAEIELTW